MSKKSICCLPIKEYSSRVPRKNFQLLDGTPLFIRAISLLQSSNFDYIYVDTDSLEIQKYCADNAIPFVVRREGLASDTSNGNDLILDSISRFPDYDIYFQLFSTAPFLKSETLNQALSILQNSTSYDSVFTAREHTTWYWSNSKPLNYDPCSLPRSQDVMPIFFETTGMYGVFKDAALERKCRIGFKPYLIHVSIKESLDIDTFEDLEFARHLV